jgi:large subunit ribosomal protein L4
MAAMAALTSSHGLRVAGVAGIGFSAQHGSSSLPAVGRGTHRVSMAATLDVLDFAGEKKGQIELDLKQARPETAKYLVHRAVITQMQNRRQGSASTLTRAEVRGGGKKPYKQKGTGRARLGSLRTPLRPGGGVVFGPKPKDWSIKINRKENQLAISTALQSAAVNMVVVEDFEDELEVPKTREFVQALSRWGVNYKEDYALLFSTKLSTSIELSARNIQKLKLMTPRTLNIYDILRADKIVITKSGLEYLAEQYPAAEFDEEEFEFEVPVENVEGAEEGKEA